MQVLATLTMLSFIKLLQNFAQALTWVQSHLVKILSATVCSVDRSGTLCGGCKHLGLMTASVLFLLLAVFYTLALLFDAVNAKHLTKIQFCHKQWIKFKPLIAAYAWVLFGQLSVLDWSVELLARMSSTLVPLYLGSYCYATYLS